MVRALEFFGRLTRAHALLLTCVCAALLLFNLPRPRAAWPALTWPNFSTANENEVDSALQQAAEDALGQHEGSIIIMDAQTGRVRATVNPEGAYSQAMMPGSSIKPFTTLAALRAGLIDEDSRTVCPGRFTGLSFSLPCVHADHLPPFNPSQAIAYSCNYYFATLGQRLGRDKLTETLRTFRFGQPTGLAEGEATGVVKPCQSGDAARIRSAQTDQASQQADCAAREALGESDHIQVTPIQLLTAYAALLNGGHLFQPQTASANSFNAIERSQINISPEERRTIIEGMAGAVRYGTARGAKLDSVPLTIVGKTGTAQPPKGFRTNGWFVGLAGAADATRELEPADIQLAVIVFLPRAHGAEAATISRPIFEAYANEISHRETEAQRASKIDSSVDATDDAASPRLPISASPVRVHLVHDNLTRELSLEDYVLGVMRAEGTIETESEALKALAVAVRTFALKNIGRHAKDGYDFCSTTHCQRFVAERGTSPTVSEGSLIDAVRATEGQVLLDQRGELIDSYFGASCGGETANVATLWGTSPAKHLEGVRDEFCETGPHAHWIDTIKRADLLRALQSDSRTDVGNRLDQITVSKRDETGRAEFITVEGEQRKVVRGWDFKIIVGRVLGWNILKSSRFEVSRSGSNFVFRGSGFGHGLGLCQEGAHVMAARGASYQRILEKYFPGTSVGRDAETRGRGDAEKTNSSNAWKVDILLDSFDHSIAASPRLRVSASILASQSPRFLTISSEHFRVTYPADTERRDANQVLTVLENARADYLRRAANASVAIDNLPLLQIRVNESTGDFVGRTGQPWWAAAATKGNKIELQPVAILKRRGVLNTTLKHELAHVVIDIVSRDRASRWLEEGFAIYLSGEGAMYSRARRGALSDEELEKRLEHPRSQADMRASYADAYLKVNEMVRNQGEASVWKKLAVT
ncbi:MAG TPA: SpoIID/LytB domain-containing protein [Pyrinomonadaceae bacterium]|jgi:stage II sporulation protein D